MNNRPIACSRRDFLRCGSGVLAALALLPAWESFSGRAGTASLYSNQSPPTELDVEDIGQMIMAGFRGYTLKEKNPIVDDLEERCLGGVVLFDYDVAWGKCTRNIRSPEQLAALGARDYSYYTIPAAADQHGPGRGPHQPAQANLRLSAFLFAAVSGRPERPGVHPSRAARRRRRRCRRQASSVRGDQEDGGKRGHQRGAHRPVVPADYAAEGAVGGAVIDGGSPSSEVH